MTSAEVKAVVREAGADLVGIASVDRFAGAPPMRRPTDLLPGTRSVIVAAVRYPPAGIAYEDVDRAIKEAMAMAKLKYSGPNGMTATLGECIRTCVKVFEQRRVTSA